MPDIISIEEYAEAVEILAKEKIAFRFANSSPNHAAVVLHYMFKYAEKEIRIYDNDLSGDVMNQYPLIFDELENFVKSGKKLDVVVRNDSNKNEKIYQTLKRYSSEYKNVNVYLASESFKDNVAVVFGKDINFDLADKKSYRMELQFDHTVDTPRKAECDFNNVERGSKLFEVFNSNITTCNPLF